MSLTYGHLFPALDEALTDGLETQYQKAISEISRPIRGLPKRSIPRRSLLRPWIQRCVSDGNVCVRVVVCILCNEVCNA